MRKEGRTMREIAAALGVVSSTISNALNHKGAYQGAGI
jgi:DNA-binding LacI/PurR family transcriptional regulator